MKNGTTYTTDHFFFSVSRNLHSTIYFQSLCTISSDGSFRNAYTKNWHRDSLHIDDMFKLKAPCKSQAWLRCYKGRSCVFQHNSIVTIVGLNHITYKESRIFPNIKTCGFSQISQCVELNWLSSHVALCTVRVCIFHDADHYNWVTICSFSFPFNLLIICS